MKLYKFRSLTSETDFSRLKRIIETSEFWCSNFWEFNDPMEGVFSIFDHDDIINKIGEVYGEKGQYKVCSFSGFKGLVNPAMWGYYTNGFKGVAIEVEVEDSIVEKVDCSGKDVKYDEGSLEEKVREILKTKGKSWEHEDEYRFIKKTQSSFNEVGKITAIYFGNPYGNIINKDDVKNNDSIFAVYDCLKNKIRKMVRRVNIAENKNIKYFDVKIENGAVEKDSEIV